jgi:hypothetical protein
VAKKARKSKGHALNAKTMETSKSIVQEINNEPKRRKEIAKIAIEAIMAKLTTNYWWRIDLAVTKTRNK